MNLSGLDPAFPLYIFQGARGHLVKGDAKFVDVIHTDGGVFGFPNAIGDADFFPNGGTALQPGCRLSQLSHRGHPSEVGKTLNLGVTFLTLVCTKKLVIIPSWTSRRRM